LNELELDRDAWKRRTGPFYPLLVAFRLQTRLPFVLSLEPSNEDCERARRWLPLVGIAVGLSLVGLSYGLRALQLSTSATAGLVLAAGVIASGAWYELGFADAVGYLSGWLDPSRGGSSDSAARVSPALLLLCKYGALAGTAPSLWVGSLMCAHVGARWAVLVCQEMSNRSASLDPAQQGGRWGALALASAITLFAAVIAGHRAGLLSILLAGVIGLAFARVHRQDLRATAAMAAASGALAELAALLCFST
jgi:cobalamin synthase